MPYLFAVLFIVGAAPAAFLGVGVRSESPRLARAARIAFAFLLTADLLLAAGVFSVDTSNGDSTLNATRSLWWVTLLLGCFPLAVASGLAVRRGYAGHRVALVIATVATASLYLAFPLGFVPANEQLRGLGRWEHDHHVLDIAILFVPALILLASELLRTKEPALAEADRSSLDSPSRRSLIGGAVVLVALVWLAGTNVGGMLLALGLLAVGSGLVLWRKHRSAVRRVRNELGLSRKP